MTTTQLIRDAKLASIFPQAFHQTRLAISWSESETLAVHVKTAPEIFSTVLLANAFKQRLPYAPWGINE